MRQQQQGSLENTPVDAQDAHHVPLYRPWISQGSREQEVGVHGTEQPKGFCFNGAVEGLDSHSGLRDMHTWQDCMEQTTQSTAATRLTWVRLVLCYPP